VNSDDGTVSVIDVGTEMVIDTISVGTTPAGITSSIDGRSMFVTNVDDDTVSRIDTVTNTVVATIPVGENPFGIAASPDGRTIYVTNTSPADIISVIDTQSNMVSSSFVVGDEPIELAFSTDGSKVYVSNLAGASVSVVETTGNITIATIIVGSIPRLLAVTPFSFVVGLAKKDIFLTQTELFNQVSWESPTVVTAVTEYRVYRDEALTERIATLPPTQFVFEEHNLEKDQSFRYYVTALINGQEVLIGSASLSS
jgi:YVTN family beta-propeller protein